MYLYKLKFNVIITFIYLQVVLTAYKYTSAIIL